MGESIRESAKKSEAAKDNRTSQTRTSDYSQPVNSLVDRILFLQRTIGNQAVGKLIRSEGSDNDIIHRDNFTPAPMPGALPPSGPAPALPGSIPQQPIQIPVRENQAHVGANGVFQNNVETKELALWEYVVYKDHIRLGNRIFDRSNNRVVGSWPWMTNNPGDLTVDVKPPKGRQQETLAFELGAMKDVAARRDLAIFSDMEKGVAALKEWICRRYSGLTISGAASSHLGPVATHKKGVDDPKKYAQAVQDFFNKTDVKINVYSKVIDETICPRDKQRSPQNEHILNLIATSFGHIEGVENIGIIYRCNGRDQGNDAKLEPWKANLQIVQKLPQVTPKEIRVLLGCP